MFKLTCISVCVAIFLVLVKSYSCREYTDSGGPYVYGEYHTYNANWFLDCHGARRHIDPTRATFVQDCPFY